MDISSKFCYAASEIFTHWVKTVVWFIVPTIVGDKRVSHQQIIILYQHGGHSRHIDVIYSLSNNLFFNIGVFHLGYIRSNLI